MTVATLKRYKPRGAAAQVFRERGPEVLLCGPAGTGKTRANLEKLHAMALLNGACPKKCVKEHEHHDRAFRGLIVRKTLVSLTSTAVVTYKEHVAKEALDAGIVSFYGGSRDEPPQYRYANGSKIMLAGMDNPTKVMSSEFDVILVVEATELSVTDWEKCKTRLRNGRLSFQQIIADCNPEQPTHWLKKRSDEGVTKMLYARHTDNPVLFNDDGTPTARGGAYLDTLNQLTGVRKLRLQGGIWAAAEGVIWERFEAGGVHVSDRKRLPYEWSRFWSVDFGYTNPFVWQQWAKDPDGRLWLELEIYQTKTLVSDHAEHILQTVKTNTGEWKYPRPRAVICDHDAEDRATLERAIGFGTIGAQKTVSDGIQAVDNRMKIQGDGLPRLFILRTALVRRDEDLKQRGLPTSTLEEIPGYVWEPSPDGKPVKDKPLKENDHGCDAMRYQVAYHDLKGRAKVRFM